MAYGPPYYCSLGATVTSQTEEVTCEVGNDCNYMPTCDSGSRPDATQCCCARNDNNSCDLTPVVVDVAGDGLALTDGAGGVSFDFLAKGKPVKAAWTEAGSDDSWLALDRNGDGRITDGREMFGNKTQQARYEGLPSNGFLALREFDTNGDWVIDARDPVFASLLLWRDSNHDGVSQPAELSKLAASAVTAVGTEYKEVGTKDRFGNLFRFKGQMTRGGKERKLYDVVLQRAQ